MSAPVDVLAVLELCISDLAVAQEAFDRGDKMGGLDKSAMRLWDAHEAVAELIDKATRHIHAVDHPVNDGADADMQERTLRALNAALTRAFGCAP